MSKIHRSIVYHIIFSTKGRQPFLQNEELRKQVYHFIWNKCKRYGYFLHRIGGVEEHIHLLIYIPPSVSVSEAVGKLKGSSSYFVNQELAGEDILYWQRGYGVLTVSEEKIQTVIDYIKNQEEHHKQGTIWADFEEMNIGNDTSQNR